MAGPRPPAEDIDLTCFVAARAAVGLSNGGWPPNGCGLLAPLPPKVPCDRVVLPKPEQLALYVWMLGKAAAPGDGAITDGWLGVMIVVSSMALKTVSVTVG